MNRAIVRGYIAGELQFEETLEFDMENLESVIAIAQGHVLRLAGPWVSMIEIDWLDGTYSRIGTDARGMVFPAVGVFRPN